MSPSMPTALLGRTGLEVTRLGFGTAPRKQPDAAQWGRLLNAVLDSGINFIDTANDYGVREEAGSSEEHMGRVISSRRSEYYLATKCGCGPDGPHIWTRENLFRALHESLGRLKTDYIDVMQLHNPTVEECEAGGLVEALQDMRQQGKVRWVGVSTTLPELPTFLEWGVFDTFQIPYSVLEREHEDWIDKAAEAGIGIIIRGGAAQGEPGHGEGEVDLWQKFEEAGLDELRADGESRTAFILRYTLTHQHSHTNIVGTSNLDHLHENVQAIQSGPLSEDVYAETKRRMDAAAITSAAAT
jgi:aryl-alcohol dehydrogenase-like predicted oxidoreductase